MKKFLLVIFVGMVLVIDVYGIIKEYKTNNVVKDNLIYESSEIVYME